MSCSASGLSTSGSTPRATTRSRAMIEPYCSSTARTCSVSAAALTSEESAYSTSGAGPPPARCGAKSAVTSSTRSWRCAWMAARACGGIVVHRLHGDAGLGEEGGQVRGALAVRERQLHRPGRRGWRCARSAATARRRTAAARAAGPRMQRREQRAALAQVLAELLGEHGEDGVHAYGGPAADELHERILQRPGAGARADRLRRARGDHRAVGDHDDLIAQLAHLVHHVAGEQHAVPGIAQLAQQRAQRAHRHDVQAVGGLVEDEVARVVHQRARQRGLQALALREALGTPVGELLHLQQLDAVRRRAGARPRAAGRAARRSTGCSRAP